MAATRDFVALSSVVCMARCNNKFVLPVLPIAENLQKCDRVLCTTCKSKEVPYGCSYNDEWFLDSGASAHFTSFESDFVSKIMVALRQPILKYLFLWLLWELSL